MPLFVERLAQTIGALHSVRIVSRKLHTDILRYALDSHPEVFSVWSVWEPNAFDGRDDEFRNQPGHDGTGRFIPSWHRAGDQLELHPVQDYERQGRGDWYWIPKKTGELCAADLHAAEIGGSIYWITSEIAPVLAAGRTLGVVGIDTLASAPAPGSSDARSSRLAKRSIPRVRVLNANEQTAGLLRLTKREREVHYWLCQGKSNEDIARILVVSPHTVKNHIDHIFQKLGVENRYAAALLHPSRTTH
ncbi:MAG: LuxR C-terminal-related transcriptional regulator [Terrimicrobiaceae bacterium]|nr:LuxR C-terminal-related transcriptional regulator [Terrimicrobiaceae bacterium]